MTCSEEDCDRASGVRGAGRGLCRMHYQRWQRAEKKLNAPWKPSPLKRWELLEELDFLAGTDDLDSLATRLGSVDWQHLAYWLRSQGEGVTVDRCERLNRWPCGSLQRAGVDLEEW